MNISFLALGFVLYALVSGIVQILMWRKIQSIYANTRTVIFLNGQLQIEGEDYEHREPFYHFLFAIDKETDKFTGVRILGEPEPIVLRRVEYNDVPRANQTN